MSYEPPIKIMITTPSEIPQGFGPNSTGGRGGNLRIRCTNREYDDIKYEAAILGLSLASFCRWCAVHAAEQLRIHREGLSTNEAAGED
jgi:uncharacterized protein (DUF1778 family)